VVWCDGWVGGSEGGRRVLLLLGFFMWGVVLMGEGWGEWRVVGLVLGFCAFLGGFDGLVGGLSGGLEYIGGLIAMIDLVVVVVGIWMLMWEEV